MLYDIITIASKELKEIMFQRGSLRSGLMNLLLIIAIVGILFPIQMGEQWLTTPLGLVSVIWMPLFMGMGLVADAFAGERERHTLETLLASRLSDSAILFGKVLAAIIYCVGIAVAGLLLGAVTVNIANPGAGFYRGGLFVGAVVFSLLTAALIAAIGVLVSLHASTVRQAYQRMSLGFLVIWLPLVLAPQYLPESLKLRIGEWMQNSDGLQIALTVAGVLLVITTVLFALAIARFQRAKLILD